MHLEHTTDHGKVLGSYIASYNSYYIITNV